MELKYFFFLCLHDADETDDDLPPFEDDADEADEDEADEPYDALPMFEDDECPPDSLWTLCVKVAFPNGMEDTLLLARDSPNSTVYEGVLMGEDDASVVLIDAPEDGERIVSLSSTFGGGLKDNYCSFYCLLN